jgi:hypothetical protein
MKARFRDETMNSAEERRTRKEEDSAMMKGLFNDLNRTLFSSAIFLDDLHLNLQPHSEVYDAWWLANEQLKRAIEFFLELRSTCFWFLDSVDSGTKGNKDGHSILPDQALPPRMGLVNAANKSIDCKPVSKKVAV